MAWHDIWSKHMIWYGGGSGGFWGGGIHWLVD